MLRNSWTKLSAAFLKTDGGIFQTSVKDLPPHWVNFTRSRVPTSRGWRHAGSNHAWQRRKSSQEEEMAPRPVCPYRSPGGLQTTGARAAREPQQPVRQPKKAMKGAGVRSPDLHAFTPGAHVLPQEEVVQGDSPHDVEHLLDHLLDQFGVHAVLTHDRVEGVELSQDGVQCVGTLVSNAGGSLS